MVMHSNEAFTFGSAQKIILHKINILTFYYLLFPRLADLYSAIQAIQQKKSFSQCDFGYYIFFHFFNASKINSLSTQLTLQCGYRYSCLQARFNFLFRLAMRLWFVAQNIGLYYSQNKLYSQKLVEAC